MAKAIVDDVYDAALDELAAATLLVVCSDQPTNYTEATSTYALADVALTAGDGNGDYTIANGDSSGRKLTVAAQSSVEVDTTGTATHLALCISASSTLLAVTTCTSKAITDGDTVNIPAFKFEIADPS